MIDPAFLRLQITTFFLDSADIGYQLTLAREKRNLVTLATTTLSTKKVYLFTMFLPLPVLFDKE